MNPLDTLASVCSGMILFPERCLFEAFVLLINNACRGIFKLIGAVMSTVTSCEVFKVLPVRRICMLYIQMFCVQADSSQHGKIVSHAAPGQEPCMNCFSN